jgi:hypothetical protein
MHLNLFIMVLSFDISELLILTVLDLLVISPTKLTDNNLFYMVFWLVLQILLFYSWLSNNSSLYCCDVEVVRFTYSK